MSVSDLALSAQSLDEYVRDVRTTGAFGNSQRVRDALDLFARDALLAFSTTVTGHSVSRAYLETKLRAAALGQYYDQLLADLLHLTGAELPGNVELTAAVLRDLRRTALSARSSGGSV